MDNGIIVFILVFIRIVSFLGVSPIFMVQGIPNTLKAGLGLVLSFLTFNFVAYDPNLLPSSMISLMWTAGGEVIFGLSLGFAVNLIFQAVKMAGQLMDIQIGLSMASEFDPITSTSVTLVGNLFNLIALIIFFLIDGHHVLIQAILQSFDIVPLLGVEIPREIAPYMLSLFIKVIALSLKIASPVVVVIFLTDFTMGLISRTVPQLNVLMLGLPIKVLIGLLTLSAALPVIIDVCKKVFENLPGHINEYFNLFPLAIIFASSDKTEEATPKKKEDARKKGQVAKSREFISAVTLVGITLLSSTLAGSTLKRLSVMLTRIISDADKVSFTADDMTNLMVYCVLEFIKATLPLFAVVMALGIIGNLVQTGLIYSTEPLKMKLNRINPISGFKRMFSGAALMELLKSCAKIVVVAYAAVSLIKGELTNIMKLPATDINAIAAFTSDILNSELSKVSIIVCIIGAVDFMYQKYAYKKEMRMTKQEVKEEYKQMEGDPKIKSRIKQKQRQLASRRMMQQVPEATVVVTNPTHLSVALKYDKESGEAPVVVAKGADSIALKIREIAKENNVPIVENKPVARMLYKEVEIGEAIPYEMYQAVAEILAFVYSLNRKARR